MQLDEFRSLVVASLLARNPDKSDNIHALKNEDDLLASGLVDSFGLIELCLALEAETRAVIDISMLEPEQFNSVAALFEVVNASRVDAGDDADCAKLRLAS